MLSRSRVFRAALVGLLFAVKVAAASSLTYGFTATLDTGALQGTRFGGSFAFDPSGAPGIGQDFVTLTALDFNLLGTRFTRADIDQGGQAILQDGHILYFTAAIFPESPTSPVSNIAFGAGTENRRASTRRRSARKRIAPRAQRSTGLPCQFAGVWLIAVPLDFLDSLITPTIPATKTSKIETSGSGAENKRCSTRTTTSAAVRASSRTC